jgi:hypothetical protein
VKQKKREPKPIEEKHDLHIYYAPHHAPLIRRYYELAKQAGFERGANRLFLAAMYACIDDFEKNVAEHRRFHMSLLAGCAKCRKTRGKERTLVQI